MRRAEMRTPICDFVSEYCERQTVRLHMPGHKGRELTGAERRDITEIDGADVLCSAKGIIAESERNASELFGSGKTLYSTEGSSLSIRAMLYLASLWGQSEGMARRVLAGRNAHRVFHSAAALLDLDVEWLYGEEGGLFSCNITAESIERALEKSADVPCAVYITSPDYLGNMLDVEAIASVCRRHGTLCLVDNAHGAYLRFLPSSRHPLEFGAHMCADSAHKTLPSLTGAGYLHIAKDAPSLLFDEARAAMALFASTSPSYLILQSLDATNRYLSEGYRGELRALCENMKNIKSELTRRGYTLIGDEPTKLTVAAGAYGYLGTEIAEWLNERGIVCEHADRDVTVLMLTPEIGESEQKRLVEALLSLERRTLLPDSCPILPRLVRATSIREATFSPKERVSVSECCGRVLAESAVSCPPCIPIAVCGEMLTDATVRILEYYGIDAVSVIK